MQTAFMHKRFFEKVFVGTASFMSLAELRCAKISSAPRQSSLFVNNAELGFTINKTFSKCSLFIQEISMICLFIPLTNFDLRGVIVKLCRNYLKYGNCPRLPQKMLKTMFKTSASAVKSVEKVVEKLQKPLILRHFSTLLKTYLSTVL